MRSYRTALRARRDELNRPESGKDYGWPVIGYGEEYSGAPIHESPQGAGMEQPVYYWDPVISPSGMTIYTGNLFPEWRSNVFIGGLSARALVRLRMHNDSAVVRSISSRTVTSASARWCRDRTEPFTCSPTRPTASC